MSYIKPALLLGIFIQVSCSVPIKPKPDVYYLPEAVIGKPYYQLIDLTDSTAPEHAGALTWPEDSGLEWHLGKTKSTTIEIVGIPKDNAEKEIKIGIWGRSHGDMFSSDSHFYKEYMIKLVPATKTSSTKNE